MRKKNTLRDLQVDHLMAGLQHTILLLEAWRHELPYSDRVTRNTLHAWNLPSQR